MRHLSPRDVNRMEGVRQFLYDWDAPGEPGNRKSVPLCPSAYGNFNSSGMPGDKRAYSLTPHHEQFVQSLEAGVRDLVVVLTGRHGFITYTSCEGHRYEGLDLPATERHVGLLPRRKDEEKRIRDLLAEVDMTVSPCFETCAAQLAVMEESLCDRSDVFPVVDLYFSKRGAAEWKDYFLALEPIYQAVVRHLGAVPPVRMEA